MKHTKEQKILQQVITEAWNNPSFKNELLNNPMEAIKNLTGKTIKLPKGVEELKVVDQMNPKYSYLNIPTPPNMENVELTDEQLEAVTGGNGNNYDPNDTEPIFGIDG